MSATYLRQATNKDLSEIKKIIDEAKAYLKNKPSINGKMVIQHMKTWKPMSTMASPMS